MKTSREQPQGLFGAMGHILQGMQSTAWTMHALLHQGNIRCWLLRFVLSGVGAVGQGGRAEETKRMGERFPHDMIHIALTVKRQ